MKRRSNSHNKTLSSGHFIVDTSIADTIFRSKLPLTPRTDISITDTPCSRSYKIFLVTDLHTFNFRHCFAIPFKLSPTFVILIFSQFNGLFRHIKIEIGKDFQSVFTSMVNQFPSRKDVQSTMGQG